MVPLNHCLWLSMALFAIGVVGFLTRRNIIVVFMSVELMFNAANLSLITFSTYLNSLRGQIFVIFVISVAAAEAAVGLAILVALYRNRATINTDEVDMMKW